MKLETKKFEIYNDEADVNIINIYRKLEHGTRSRTAIFNTLTGDLKTTGVQEHELRAIIDFLQALMDLDAAANNEKEGI